MKLKKNSKKKLGTRLEIQIGDNKPFIPDRIGKVGVFHGWRDITNPEDVLRCDEPYSHVAIVEYEYNGGYFMMYFKRGMWEMGKKDRPRFHVWDLLE